MKQMPAPLLTLLADAVPNHFGSWNINATVALLVVQRAIALFIIQFCQHTGGCSSAIPDSRN
jgi:hypothetical protein